MKNKKTKLPIIYPRGSWLLVKPADVATENEFGLTIPDSVEKEQKSQGEIIEVGPKVDGLKKGQIVMYGAFAGEPIQLKSKHEQYDKVDLVLLLDEDVLAVIE
mgnify:CR=1 FL=1